MSEKLSKEKILEIAAKLLNVSEQRGATSNEALVAMETLQKMLQKHGLSMLEIEKHKLKEQGFGIVKEEQGSVYSNIPDYMLYLAQVVAKGFDCRMIHGRRAGKGLYIFVGTEMDAALALYLFNRTSDELYEWASKDAKERRLQGAQIAQFRKCFIAAAAQVIGDRLEAAKVKNVSENSNVGTMIVLKRDLVGEWINNNMHVKKGDPLNLQSGAGTEEGMRAGTKIDLTMHGLKGSKTKSSFPKLGG